MNNLEIKDASFENQTDTIVSNITDAIKALDSLLHLLGQNFIRDQVNRGNSNSPSEVCLKIRITPIGSNNTFETTVINHQIKISWIENVAVVSLRSVREPILRSHLIGKDIDVCQVVAQLIDDQSETPSVLAECRTNLVKRNFNSEVVVQVPDRNLSSETEVPAIQQPIAEVAIIDIGVTEKLVSLVEIDANIHAMVQSCVEKLIGEHGTAENGKYGVTIRSADGKILITSFEVIAKKSRWIRKAAVKLEFYHQPNLFAQRVGRHLFDTKQGSPLERSLLIEVKPVSMNDSSASSLA